ncbi:replication initiator [Nocardia gamkensis]|uniref:replication initiator n=1 Tax=Nocardia gamkensis TaxID=352869 RepID=UPI00157D72E4|nr:replication initiator [Nocardia gamkensis]
MNDEPAELPATDPDRLQPGGEADGVGRPPTFDDIAMDAARTHGVCIRPMVLEQTDTETGRVEFVAVPCGNTMAAICPACAAKAKALRQTQLREGWHLEVEPQKPKSRPTFDQLGLILYRADQTAAYQDALAGGRDSDAAEIRAEIDWADKQLKALGARGTPPSPEPPAASSSEQAGDDGADDCGGSEPVGRSTKRPEGMPELPRLPIHSRTIGREYAGRFKPSMFVTLTLDSYGPVHREDGTPIDPDSYDYARAAWDAICFAALFDRWIQNLRRAVGWNVQYFATVEPQRRGAPMCTSQSAAASPAAILRQVTAGTYRQIWWPRRTEMTYTPDRVPLWDRAQRTFVDPDTRQPLQSWDEAIAAIGPEDDPAHMAVFGSQMDIRGVLGGTEEAKRHIGYLCKYLTKSVDEVLEARTARQQTHYDRLHEALCRTPCSPRCAVWLMYGIVPKGAKSRMQPGQCRGRAHRRTTLGLPGRRVLCSQLWTGKTLDDHKADRIEFVRQLLANVGITRPARDPHRYTWNTITPGTRIPSRAYLLMHAVAERLGWRAQYEKALLAAQHPPEPSSEEMGYSPEPGAGDTDSADTATD